MGSAGETDSSSHTAKSLRDYCWKQSLTVWLAVGRAPFSVCLSRVFWKVHFTWLTSHLSYISRAQFLAFSFFSLLCSHLPDVKWPGKLWVRIYRSAYLFADQGLLTLFPIEPTLESGGWPLQQTPNSTSIPPFPPGHVNIFPLGPIICMSHCLVAMNHDGTSCLLG